MRKQCFKCGEVKPLSEFYKHRQMSDGHVNKCKECNKADVRENRKSNIEFYREYDRKRGSRQPVGYQKEYKRRNPIKYAAHVLVSNHIRDGKLKRSDQCEYCGSTRAIHGHHDDYSKPLEVTWLCAACHRQWHIKNGEAKNAG